MIKIFITVMLSLSLVGCMRDIKPAAPRTIILNGEKVTESASNEFQSWRCKDYIRGGKTIIEVGLTSQAFKLISGYVLYDGTNEGTIATYQRSGINHRWDWGQERDWSQGLHYSFVLKPDGKGLYYDFSSVKEGESTNASDVFKCYKY